MSPEVQAVVDPDERIATITTRFDQPIDVVWTLWSDPDKLARWWGPPGLRMTVDHHDLRPGGRVDVTVYVGDSVIRGHWSILAVDAPGSLRFTFSSEGLEPTAINVLIEPATETATTMTITARFASAADFDHAIEIGFVDGITRATESAHTVL